MSLMHNIRNFAETQLQGIIPWSKFSFPDEVHTDVANVSIEGKQGLYRIVVSSSYAMPPLGHVKFTDHGNGHEIEGQNQDGTWHLIAEYLKGREKGEDPAAVEHDIATNLIRGMNPAVMEAAGALLLGAAPVIPLPVAELQIPPVALVWYLSDPGVWYQNGPALVTRVNADGSYNLTVMPDGSEPFYRQNVGARSDTLRNVCWVAYPGTRLPIMAMGEVDEADRTAFESPGHIVNIPNDHAEEIAELRAMVAELQETISRLKASAFDQRKSA